jgi:GrpB-like predicted nucleotidyltransferase (UPF0157 family)/uncharacterized protein (DUF952 family)
MPRPITLAPYNPQWFEEFKKESQLIARALGDELVAIHHIGSTAINGIKAKPVVDILPEVHGIEKIDALNGELVKLGYTPRGENGIPLRRYFTKERNGVRAYQLHIFQSGNAEIVRHLNFRDYLRAHPNEAKAYEALKEKLATRFDNTLDYANAKSDFVREMDRRASEWKAQLILHITPVEPFRAQENSGRYVTESLTKEGFIHCTKEPEVMLRVANRFYKDVKGDVLILVIDPRKVKAGVKYEPPAHPEPDPNSPHNKILFPHIYGALNLDAVIEIRFAERSADGTFQKV